MRTLFHIEIKSTLLLLVIVIFYSCTPTAENANAKREMYAIPDSLMKTLILDTVKLDALSRSIKFNGIIDFNPDKVANIFPMISGNVQDIHVMVGDYVKAGQVLGLVKSAEMANYNAALINAESAVQLTARQLQQQQELFKSGLASQVELTNAQVAYQQALSSKTAAEKILNINGNNRQGEYYIKSPIDGFIVQKNINNGMTIRTDNSNSLFTISDLKEVWVQANVYEANIEKVQQGDNVEVTTIAYPDKVYKASISRLMNVLDPTSRVMKMRVVLSNTDFKLKPQMFATVTVNNRENKQAIRIASSSLIFDHSQYFVLVFKSQKDVQIRPVEIISTNGSRTYIKSGIQAGDVLVSSDALQIYGALNN